MVERAVHCCPSIGTSLSQKKRDYEMTTIWRSCLIIKGYHKFCMFFCIYESLFIRKHMFLEIGSPFCKLRYRQCLAYNLLYLHNVAPDDFHKKEFAFSLLGSMLK